VRKMITPPCRNPKPPSESRGRAGRRKHESIKERREQNKHSIFEAQIRIAIPSDVDRLGDTRLSIETSDVSEYDCSEIGEHDCLCVAPSYSMCDEVNKVRKHALSAIHPTASGGIDSWFIGNRLNENLGIDGAYNTLCDARNGVALNEDFVARARAVMLKPEAAVSEQLLLRGR